MSRPLYTFHIEEKMKSSFEAGFFDGILNAIIAEEKITEPFELSLSFVSDIEIKRLNKKYRDKNALTNVLSFRDADSEMPFPTEEDIAYWGDVIISRDTARRHAQEKKHSFEKEVAFLTIHGILHLLDYDHERSAVEEKRMFDKTDRIMDTINNQL